MSGLIGRKLGMTRVFDADGAHVPVTVIEAGPCPVVQVTGGAGNAQLQLGFGAKKPKRTHKALAGHVKRAGLEVAPRVLQSFPVVGEAPPPKPGDRLTVTIFAAGDRVKVTGVTKGRGFQGVVHRHHFGGGPETHGNTRHRKPGSIAPGTDPSRIIKGTHDTRTRSEVSGGNQKPWRQKGTGRARQGSIRAPQWRHGGIVFGPHPRDYRLGIPKKVRQLAKKSALNARAREAALLVVDPLEYEKPKTKTLAELLAKLGVAEKKVLVLTAGAGGAHNVYLSGRNIPNVRVMRFADATAYEILWSDAVVVELPALGVARAGRRPSGKKAIVTLKEGDAIAVFEG